MKKFAFLPIPLGGCLFADPSIPETCEDIGNCLDRDRDGFTEDDGDCDDQDPDRNPDAPEVCDSEGIDENCNGLANDEDPDVTDALEAFEDIDGDGWGDVSLGFACTVPEGAATLPGDCDDADPEMYPSAEEICNNGKDDNCDSSPGDCRPFVGTVARADAEIAPLTATGFLYFGYWTDSGDLDGDGIPEVVTGAPTADSYAGRAAIFSNVTSNQPRDFNSADAYILSTGSDYFGTGTVVADADGDGQTDLLVAAASGSIRVFAGPITETLGVRDAWLTIDGINDAVWDVHGAAIAETTGDDAPDIHIADPLASDGQSYGAILSYEGPLASGTLNGETDATSQIWIGTSTPADLVLRNADLNGDGVDDLIIADAYATAAGLSGAGKVWILYGGGSTPDIDLVDIPDSVSGTAALARAGKDVSAGDLNGDGLNNLVVTAPGSGERVGQAFIFAEAPAGAISVTDASTTFQQTRSGTEFGQRTAVGDLTANGTADLAIAEPGEWNVDAGEVHIAYGPLAAGTFTDRQFDAHLIGGTGADGESLLNYGYSVNALDDLDGDGSAELGISGGGDMLDIHFGGGW